MLFRKVLVIFGILVGAKISINGLEPNQWSCHDTLCFFHNKTPSTWDEAYVQCAKDRGYLLDSDANQERFDFLETLRQPQAQTTEYFWAAMKKINNYYQWLGNITGYVTDSKLVFVKWDQSEPMCNSGSCIAMWANRSVIAQPLTLFASIRTRDCSDKLPFVCTIEKKFVGIRDTLDTGNITVTLLVTDIRSNDTTHLTMDEFQKLKLDCIIESPIVSADKLNATFNWVKNGIYLFNSNKSLNPSETVDLTLVESDSIYNRQGLYSCELRIPGIPQEIQSNKIYVQLENILTVLVTATKNNPVSSTPFWENLPNQFMGMLKTKGIDVTSISTWNKLEDGCNLPNKKPLPELNYYWYINLTFENPTSKYYEDLHYAVEDISKQLSNHTIQISFPTTCLEDIIDISDQHQDERLTWKATKDGMVISPEFGLCLNSQFQPLTRKCEWQLPQAKWSSFNSEECNYFGNKTPTPWNQSLETCFKARVEMTFLDLDIDLHQIGFPGQFWLPYKRLWPYGPITHVPVHNIEFQDLETFISNKEILWGQREPSREKNCLAIDASNNTNVFLFMSECNIYFPSACFRPKMYNEDGQGGQGGYFEQHSCPEGWISYTGRKECYKDFTNFDTMFTWNGANEYCQSVNGRLINIESYRMQRLVIEELFLNFNYDWPIWINMKNSNMTFYNNEGRIIKPVNITFSPDTDWKAQFGYLTLRGYINFKGPNDTIFNIICELVPAADSFIKISVAVNHSLLVTPPKLQRNDEYSCYWNGYPVYNLDNLTQQGYYQCQTFNINSLKYVESNIILYKNNLVSNFIVKLLDKNITYNPQLHDPSFRNYQQIPLLYDIQQTLKRNFTQIITTTITNITNSISGGVEITAQIATQQVEHDGIKNKLISIFTDKVFINGRLFETIAVRSSSRCPENKMVVEFSTLIQNPGQYSEYKWPESEIGQYALSSPPCMNRVGKPAVRLCMGDFNEGGYWAPLYIPCERNGSDLSISLWELSKQPGLGSISNANDIIESRVPELNYADIYYTVQLLEHNISDPTNELASIVRLGNNLLEVKTDILVTSQQYFNTSNRITSVLERLALDAVIPNNTNNITHNKEHLSVQVWDLNYSNVVGFTSNNHGKLREINTLYANTTFQLTDADDAALIIPKAFIQNTTMQKNLKNDSLRVSFIVYDNDKFYNTTGLGDMVINSIIVQTSLKEVDVTYIDPPVEIYFKPFQKSDSPICVFWDYSKNDGNGSWSREGCEYVGHKNGLDICHCNHLTPFAELFSYNDDTIKVYDRIHKDALDIITKIGFCLSLLGQGLVFATFILFKQWRKPLGNKIVVNLCFALFAVYILFLGGFDQTSHYHVCLFVSVALHYFIIATFCWMVVEAIHQYLRFVKVVGTYIPNFMTKAAIGAWGFPSLLVIIFFGYDHTLYIGGDQVCWMSINYFYFSFLLPIAIIMTANVIIYSLILKSISCKPKIRTNQPKHILAISQIRMAISVFILLGLSWIFGILAVSNARLAFSYLFCIFSTLQGFFIFILHVIQERKSRNLWKTFLGVCGNSK